MSAPKLFLNSEEAATATGVSVDTIKRAIRAGRLRAKRSARKENGDPAGVYLITIPALEEWVDGMADA